MKIHAFGAFALGMVTAILLPGSAGAQQNLERLGIIIGAASNAVYWDIHAGMATGIFRSEGFDPVIVPVTSSPQSMQMLLTNAGELVISQPEPLLAAIEQGASDVKIMAVPARRPDWLLVGRPDIKGIADLKGKTLGFSGLKVGDFWLTQNLLEARGLGKRDWDGIQVGTSPAKLAALQNGSIAAAALFEPSATIAVRSGFTALERYSSIEGYPVFVQAVRQTWASERDRGPRLSRALAKAHAWLYDPANREQAISILQNVSKVDREIAEKVYQSFFVTDKSYSPDGVVDVKTLDSLIKLMVENGVIKSELKSDTYLLPANLGGLHR